ncbi:MAG: Hemolysin-type calcium-binding region [Candidatus Magnetoglobus multicellularis str. Araruama]|uniref:Hemolysin-type calcium-binding region n=1 Tax=Candidatus Magnetoglobus multicellularis str. Araruama TaxID=890399 RepID=A0A1V1P5M9_9BACT|nr:MAG: Hemolysin-type calcium-binding region [Candidatus Magnetoglobus multicellularis str. Araruama]
MNLLKFNTQRLFIGFILSFVCLYTSSYAGIPEPETIIYGKIINNYKGYNIRVKSGVLNWQIIDTSLKQFVYSTHLDNVDDKYSYVLKIPKETAASIILQSGNCLFDDKDMIVISDKVKEISNISITVDDYDAHIVSPANSQLTLEQDARLETFRIDLEINSEPQDTDSDGIPDFWEIAHNTDLNFAEDAAMDPDNDGWDNKKEFEMGANPVVSNLIPAIAEKDINQRIPLGTRIVFNLNVLDSDSIHENILIKLIQPPDGGSLILCTDKALYNDQVLKKDDRFSVKDIASGRVHLSHTNPLISEINMELQVWNTDAENLARNYTITTTVWNPTDDFDSNLWIDIFKPSENDYATLVDHSGNQNHSIEVFGQPMRHENASPSGKSCLFMDGRSFYRYGKDPIKGTSTIFSVFKSTDDQEQTLWHGTYEELNLTDINNPLYPARLNIVTSQKILYGAKSYLDQWMLSSIDLTQENMISFINNQSDQIHVKDIQSITSSEIHFQIAARQQIIIDNQTNELSRSYTNSFEGYLAEILMISKDLTPIDKWRIHGYLLSKWVGYVINDLSFETKDLDIKSYSFSKDNQETPENHYQDYMLIGGYGNDTIEGAAGDDILVGGKGYDVFQGHAGKDIFVVANGDTILDYNIKEGDVIHIRDILKNNGGTLDQYIKLEKGETYTLLGINADGQGQNYLDAVIRLENTILSNKDIAMLWANGNIESGGLSMPIQIESTLISDTAYESLQKPAEMEISIESDMIPENIFIPFSINGDGIHGIDFKLKAQVYHVETNAYTFEDITHVIPIKLKPGDNQLIIQILPIADQVSENDETISLSFIELSSLYKLSNNDPLEITIKDGVDCIKIASNIDKIQEANNAVEIVVYRTGSIDRGQRIDLIILGNAKNGDDYTYIPSSVVLREGESRHGLKIEAYQDEDVEREEMIEVLIKESDDYIIDKSASSVVISIVDKDTHFVNPLLEKREINQLGELILMLKVLSGKAVGSELNQPVTMKNVLLLLREID